LSLPLSAQTMGVLSIGTLRLERYCLGTEVTDEIM
jgi:hypothetical protein